MRRPFLVLVVCSSISCGAPLPESSTVHAVLSGTSWSRDGGQQGAQLTARPGPSTDVDGDGFADLIADMVGWDDGFSNEGRCVVFAGGPVEPAPVPTWSTTGGQADAALRCRPAGDVDGDGYGDVLAAAPGWSGGAASEGRALLYCGSPSGLGSTPCWAWEAGQAGAGIDLAIALGDIDADGAMDIGVGAPGWDGAQTDEGAVFVFLGTGAGPGATPDWTWTCNEAGCGGSRIWGVGDLDADGFGDLLVGAPDYSGGTSAQGRVELFAGSATGPASSPSWIELGGASGARLGSHAAAAGDIDQDGQTDLLVSADGGGGTVRLWSGGPLNGLGTPVWTASGAAGEALGPLAAGVDVLSDGYPDFLVGRPESTGAADLYGGGVAAPPPELAWTGTEGNGDGFGRAAQWLVDGGDAKLQVAISEPQYEAAFSEEGRLHGKLAGGGALDPTSDATWSDASVPAYGWAAMGEPADHNGDGYHDLLIPTVDWPDATTVEGRAELRYGGPSGLGAVGWTAEGGQADSYLGFTHSVGDVNGDGYDDLLLPAWRYDGAAGTNSGELRLWFGGPAGLAAGPDWTLEGTAPDESLGVAVVLADFNCDGFADVAAARSNGTSREVAIFPSDGATPASSPSVVLVNPTPTQPLGTSFTAADFDGDGCEDLAAGSFPESPVLLNEGTVRVFLGGPSGLSTTASWMESGGIEEGRLSWWMSAGDLDNDGFGDLLTGSTYGMNVPGRIRAWYGSPTGFTGPTTVTNSASWVMGAALADLDADGFANVLLGSPNIIGGSRVFCPDDAGLPPSPCRALDMPGNMTGSGDYDGDGFGDVATFLVHNQSVSLWYGGPGADVVPATRPPRARQLDGSPLAPGNRSDSVGFEVFWPSAWLPEGPGRVRIQVEVKPGGTPFDGSGLTAPATFSPLLTPSDLTFIVDGLVADTAYHWRARLERDPSQAPITPVTRWFYGDLLHPQGVHLRTAVDGDGDGFAIDLDCDDADPSIHPGAPEVCDGIDQDCDATADEDFDGDGDGALDGADAGCLALVGGAAVDCDDSDATAYPGATEVCDGDLEDCVGLVDFGFDADGDGAFDGAVLGCAVAYGAAADCDDGDPLIHPGAAEGCDGVDTDCDASLGGDEIDDDLDGITECDGDCDDSAALISPDSDETCNGLDDDCDGAVDGSDPDTDADVDGWSICDDPPDCDDTDPDTWPGAAESCNDGLDTDCDGSLVDEFLDTDGDGSPDCWDPDADGDGFASLSEGGADCDDLAATVHPGAAELCDGVDNDCASGIPGDELDGDGDGWVPCQDWSGEDPLIEGGGDCADSDPDVHPERTELCDGVDQDCDGAVDEDLPVLDWFRDRDGDGHGDPEEPHVDNPRCDPGEGWAESSDDCDDSDSDVHPGAVEIEGNPLDEDCDGVALGAPATTLAPAPGCACSAGAEGPEETMTRGLLALLLVCIGAARRRRPGQMF